MRIIQPYEHHCSKCVWVSWIYIKGGGKFGSDWGNMYLCDNKTVIIRFSDEGSDYWSCTAGECVKGSLGIKDNYNYDDPQDI